MENCKDPTQDEFYIVYDSDGREKVDENGERVKMTFEEYIQKCVLSLEVENRIDILKSALFQNLMLELTSVRLKVLKLCKENSGKWSKDSTEFKNEQDLFWVLYRMILITRSFILGYYMIREPKAPCMLHDRNYCGLYLSAEDCDKFFSKPPRELGFTVNNKEIINEDPTLEKDTATVKLFKQMSMNNNNN